MYTLFTLFQPLSLSLLGRRWTCVDLCGLAVLAEDHPREGVGEPGVIRAYEGACLVHVRPHLEVLGGRGEGLVRFSMI